MTAATASPATACVTQVYGELTLAQRVGQLFLVAPTADIAGSGTQTALAQYHFGSILLPKNADGTTSLAAATAAIQALAPADTHDVRFLIGANQEGGEIQQLTGPGFDVMPSALVQGSLDDERAADPGDRLGDPAPRRGREPQPGAGHGHGPGGHRVDERADRGA